MQNIPLLLNTLRWCVLLSFFSLAKEYCRVTFTFDATNDDELRLKEGDIIQILSKV